MKRIGLPLLLLAAIFGLASLYAVHSGWANYTWDRYVYGRVVYLSDRCYRLPYGWTVIPGGDKGVTNIRRHYYGETSQAFASILPLVLVERAKLMSSGPMPIDGGFVMYDLGSQSPGGSLRFIAMNEIDAIAVMATNSGLLRELTAGLAECE